MKKVFFKCFCFIFACLIMACSSPSSNSYDPSQPSGSGENVTLSFVKNSESASGSMDSISGKAGSTVKIPECSFTNSEFSFTAWNTLANGNGTSYSAGDNYVLPSKNSILYAQWQKKNTNSEPAPVTSEDWAGQGWYAFVYKNWTSTYWYIAEFDSEKNLISKNRSNETAYVEARIKTDEDWPKTFYKPSKTDKADWDSFKTLKSSWEKIYKFTDTQMEENLVNALWLLNKKNLEENAIYHALYNSNDYYFLFDGTDFSNSNSPFAYTTYRASSTDPMDEFNYFYNSSSFYPFKAERIIIDGYENLKMIPDEELPDNIRRAFRVESSTDKNYKYSYKTADNKTFTCYAKYDSSGFSKITVAIDENQNYEKKDFSYKNIVAYKDFSVISDEQLPLQIKNVFLEPHWNDIYTYTDGTSQYYAKICSASYNEYNANMATIIIRNTDSNALSVPENPALKWFSFAIGATSEISVLTYDDVSEQINTLLYGAPNVSDLYTYTDASGNTVYTKFSSYMGDRNYNYTFYHGLVEDKDTRKYSPLTGKSITDWPNANLANDFKKLNSSETSALSDIVKYYTETSLSAGHGINSTVFKFLVKDGYSYYAYYSSGRDYSPYLAKSQDGNSFTKVNSSELIDSGIAYDFDTIVFSDDFEVTNINTNLIENAE